MSGLITEYIRRRRSLPDAIQHRIDHDPLDGPIVDVRADVDAQEREPEPVAEDEPADEVARLRLEFDWADRVLGP